jgi:hypothetical protein
MAGCSECPSPVEHIPEECPAAEWYGSPYTNAACEAYFLTTSDGRLDTAGLTWGTEEWYQAVIDGTRLMHEISECQA